jgi:hypothetical protein
MGEVLKAVERALELRQSAGSLVMRFDFPPQVQGACEQYLTYFGQFLRDLAGVEVETSLKHQGTAALFSVTPLDQFQALEQVSRALAIYLELLGAPGMDVAAYESEDRQVLQMVAMVRSYSAQLAWAKGEVRAAQAELQARAREIEALEQVNERHLTAISDQRALLQQQARALESANVLLESLRSVQRDGQDVDKEELLGGFLIVGTMEEKGLGINWALGLRKLRGLLSGTGEHSKAGGSEFGPGDLGGGQPD